MKIDSENAARLSAEKRENAKGPTQKPSAGACEKTDFKAMLARKSDAAQPASKRGEFGAKLRDGRVQVGEQAEASSRSRVAREAGQVREEKRVEQRHGQHHTHRVGSEAGQGERAQKTRQISNALDTQIHKQVAQKGEASALNAQKAPVHAKSAALGEARAAQPGVGAGARDAAGESAGMASSAAEGVLSQPEARTELKAGAGASSSAEQTQRREQVAKIARALVDKAHIGTDMSGRQIVMMELEVPGRGQIRVRLRRRGDGFELRMRPENQQLARDLRQERHQFRQSAAQRGVSFSSIEIV